MRSFFLLHVAVLVCAMPAMAQNPTGSGSARNPAAANTVHHPTKAAAPAPAAVELPAETPVVTLRGVCEPGKKSESADCKTVITRGQMDQIAARMAPGATQAYQPQLTIKYARMLAAAKLAEDRKLQENPAVAAELQKTTGPARAEVLAKAFYRQIEEDAANVPNDELQQYYAEHKSSFEEGEVWRLSLPITGYSRDGIRFNRATIKTEADGLRTRALGGFDFDQLQAQAYKDLGIPQPPPPTQLTMARRNSMPDDQATVFDLQPGEITPVIESYGKLVILKLVSKHIATFESMSPEIKGEVTKARLRQEMEKDSKTITADFNLQYLGISAQPALFTVSGDARSAALAGVPTGSRRRAVPHRRATPNPPATATQTPSPH